MSHVAYDQYRDSGSDWLGPIPATWSYAPVWAVASCNDEVLNESTPPDEAILYVEISGVTAGQGITEATEYSFEAAPSRARRRVRDGDVLVSTVRTYLRAIAPVVSPPPNMIVSTGFAVLRPHGVAAKYLRYAVQAEYFISEVIARSVGVSYPAINASDLMRIRLPVPSPKEQVAIAAFLDRETSKIDALVEEQRRLIELLKEKRQAVISHAVTKGLNPHAKMKPSGAEWLGQVPNHWQVVPLRALFHFVKRQNGDQLEVLSVYRDHGVIHKASRDDNNNKTPEDLSKYQTVYPGDLVVNKMKAWQGSLGVSDYAGITSPDYAVFEPRHAAVSAFLNLLLRCNLLPTIYRSISNGIRPDQWRVEPEKLQELRVPLPPRDEQERIARYLSEAVAGWEALSSEAERSIQILTERRSALISAAVTGRIDVRHRAAGVSNETDTTRLRILVAAEIVDRFSHKHTFGRVKLQKILYLAEAEAGIGELQGQYLREAAGPLDRTLIAEVDAGLQQDHHVTVVQSDGPGSQVVYHLRGQRGAYHEELIASIGDRAATLSDLVEKVGDLDTKSIEAVATLYAVWNDALLDHREPTDAMVVSGMLEDWHPEKARKFKAEELLTWLGWMRRNKLVPRGSGPRTTTGRLFV